MSSPYLVDVGNLVQVSVYDVIPGSIVLIGGANGARGTGICLPGFQGECVRMLPGTSGDKRHGRKTATGPLHVHGLGASPRNPPVRGVSRPGPMAAPTWSGPQTTTLLAERRTDVVAAYNPYADTSALALVKPFSNDMIRDLTACEGDLAWIRVAAPNGHRLSASWIHREAGVSMTGQMALDVGGVYGTSVNPMSTLSVLNDSGALAYWTLGTTLHPGDAQATYDLRRSAHDDRLADCDDGVF